AAAARAPGPTGPRRAPSRVGRPSRSACRSPPDRPPSPCVADPCASRPIPCRASLTCDMKLISGTACVTRRWRPKVPDHASYRRAMTATGPEPVVRSAGAEELTPHLLYALLRLRTDVFV